VIIHCYVTRVYKNVFYFTSLAPRSIFVHLAFVLGPHDIFLLTWHFVLVHFYYPIIWRSYFLCTPPLSTWYHLIFVPDWHYINRGDLRTDNCTDGNNRRAHTAPHRSVELRKCTFQNAINWRVPSAVSLLLLFYLSHWFASPSLPTCHHSLSAEKRNVLDVC